MSNDFSASNWPSRRTPEYKKPPVIETALAVEFAPIRGWNIVQYGALWERFRARYPKVEVFPAPQEFITRPQLDFANPPVRCFFIAAGDNQLVQIRSGAFVRNWRASQEDHIYPRYKTIRPSFEEDFQIFLTYLSEQGLGSPEIWKCEVTYVNHFLRGREWQAPIRSLADSSLARYACKLRGSLQPATTGSRPELCTSQRHRADSVPIAARDQKRWSGNLSTHNNGLRKAEG